MHSSSSNFVSIYLFLILVHLNQFLFVQYSIVYLLVSTCLHITCHFLCAGSDLHPYVTYVADNIQRLLVALASINPDSTLRVIAAYQSSSKQHNILKQIIPNRVVDYHGYPEIVYLYECIFTVS